VTPLTSPSLQLSPCILVIDDDPGTLQSFAAIIRSWGLEAVTAETGRIGLALAQARSPELVLLDLGLPDVTGMEVLKALRQTGMATRVVIVTGFGTVSSALEAGKSGADGYIEKPASPEALWQIARPMIRSLPATDPKLMEITPGHRPENRISREGAVRPATADDRIREVMRIIDADLAAHHSIGDLASRVGLGDSRLRHLFREFLSMSIGSYRKMRRLDIGADLLVGTHMRISEIADAVGLAPTAFDKAFRRRFGTTPREYRVRSRSGW